MRKKALYPKHLLILLLLLAIGACTTEKNTVATRAYHNLNSRFNGYYWGGESLKEGVGKIESGFKDNYNKILPIFLYPDAQTVKNILPEMDRAILKTEKVIQNHTITDKKKHEIPGAVKWIDDNYLLMGKAQFYKRDFFVALETFEYVATTYPKASTRHEAKLWMIRAYNELGLFEKGESLITTLREDKNFPNSYLDELEILAADHYIKRGVYEKAIVELNFAIDHTKNKKLKSRLIYILGQLYQQDGQNRKAFVQYGKVVQMNPSYDMSFNAKLNQAKLYDTKSRSSKQVKRDLIKMSKEAKYVEFLDQIYYVLAQIEIKEEQVPAAIDYLNSSVKASVANDGQKALSYLSLADIHFDMPDYKKAEMFYDSTMTVLPKDFPGYDKIASKRTTLNELIKNLRVIEHEDSLQALGKMEPKDREKEIAKIIRKIEEEEQRQKELEEQAKLKQALTLSAPGTTNNGTNASNNWYFNNPTLITQGFNEFVKKWGNDRKLEDNWRRNNKESAPIGSPDAIVVNTDSSANTIAKNGTADKKNPEYYERLVPVSPEQFAQSDEKIVEAYYNVGGIYKENLQNLPKASLTFEELLNRYPENKYKLSCYYQLFRLYLKQEGKMDKAEYYKSLILDKYPETEYALIIKNPQEHASRTKAKKNEIEQFYAQTYDYYQSGDFTTCISNCDKALVDFAKSDLIPRFELLKAMSIGRSQEIKNFESALTRITINYPKTDVATKAQQLLEAIKRIGAEKAAADSSKSMINYIFNPTASYYGIITINANSAKLDEFKIALSDFNGSNFGSDNLNITSAILGSGQHLVVVKSLSGKDNAMNYFNTLMGDPDVFLNLDPGGFEVAVISAENYGLFFDNNDVSNYYKFFKEKYLK